MHYSLDGTQQGGRAVPGFAEGRVIGTFYQRSKMLLGLKNGPAALAAVHNPWQM